MCDKFKDCRCSPFGGPHSVACLVAPLGQFDGECPAGRTQKHGWGLGGAAMLMRENAIADPIYLADKILSCLWPVNLMKTPSEAHRLVAASMIAQHDTLYVDARGTAKTTLLQETGGVYQHLRFPNDCCVYLGSSEPNAKALAGQERAHYVQNPILRSVFPEYAMPDNEVGSVLAYSLPCRTLRTKEESVEIGTVGSRLAGRHYARIGYSDGMNEQTTPPPCGLGTLETMKSLIAWFAQADGLLLGKEVCPHAHKAVDSNRWHDADQAGEIIRKDLKGTWTKVVRGVKGSTGHFVSSWPEVKSPEMIQEIYDSPTMNTATFAANYRSDPLPDGGMAFSEKWFKWRGKDWKDRPEKLKIAITCDVAWTEAAVGSRAARRSDRTAIVVSGVAPLGGPHPGDLFILETAAGRWGEDETVERMFAMCQFWRPLWLGFEKTNGSLALEKILLLKMLRDGGRVPFRHLKVAGRDKFVRMTMLHRHAEHYGIYVEEKHRDLVEELVRFGVAEHDDLADAAAHRGLDMYPAGGVARVAKPTLTFVPPPPPETAESIREWVKSRTRARTRPSWARRTA